jgi:hypothetical protein
LALWASVGNRAATAKQIGYVMLNSTELDNVDALLAALSTPQTMTRTIFSSLESTDITLP